MPQGETQAGGAAGGSGANPTEIPSKLGPKFRTDILGTGELESFQPQFLETSRNCDAAASRLEWAPIPPIA